MHARKTTKIKKQNKKDTTLALYSISLLSRLLLTLFYSLVSWMSYYFLIAFLKDVYRRRRIRKSSPKWIKWFVKLLCASLAIIAIFCNFILFVNWKRNDASQDTMIETVFDCLLCVWLYIYLILVCVSLHARLQQLSSEIKSRNNAYHVSAIYDDNRSDAPNRNIAPAYAIHGVLDPHHANRDAIISTTTIKMPNSTKADLGSPKSKNNGNKKNLNLDN
jgi:hypothetical protein